MDLIKSYLTDLINIIPITIDQNGVSTEGTIQSNIPASLEDEKKLIRDHRGRELVSNGFIMIDESATIDYTSRIQLVKINGVTQSRQNKKYSILKLNKAHGFENSHWEVWLG